MASITDRSPAFQDRRHSGRHRRQNNYSLTDRLRELSGDSLFRNSAFLGVNLVISAVCGLVALSLFTHFYSVTAVGLTAVAMSAGGLIAFITQFGVSYTLPRFLATSSYRTDLINTVLTVTMYTTLIGSIVFLILPVATKLYALGGAFFAVMFLLCTTIDAGQTQLETVLVADRAANKITSANLVTNFVKITAPLAFVSFGMSGAYIARNSDMVASFIVLVIVLARRGHRFRPALSAEATRGLMRFSLGAYISSQIGSMPLLLLPIVILNHLGAAENAYWFTAMSIGTLLSQLLGCVAQALMPEAAHRPDERGALVRRSSALIGAIAIPMYALAYALAPFCLSLFGSRYEMESLAPLHWLILAGVISCMNYVTGTILYLAKKTSTLTIINTINAIIVLGLAFAWAKNASDVAICWLFGEIANVLLLALFALIALQQVRGRWAALGEDTTPVAVAGQHHRNTHQK